MARAAPLSMTASIVGGGMPGGNWGDAPIRSRTIFQDITSRNFTGNTALQGYPVSAFPAGIITPGGAPRGGYVVEVLFVANNNTGGVRTLTCQFTALESGGVGPLPAMTFTMPSAGSSFVYRALLQVWPFASSGRYYVITLEDGTSQVFSSGAQGVPVIRRVMTTDTGDGRTPVTVSPFQISVDLTNINLFFTLLQCTVLARSREVN
jgi:hypothetical protein